MQYSTKSTVAEMFRPMMGRPSIIRDRCCVCGEGGHLEQHHVVRRSAGKLFDESGHELKAPTVTLCGRGNTCGCHGLAHRQMLHFRWVQKTSKNRKDPMGAPILTNAGHWEYILLDEPTKYQDALEMSGWRRL